MEITSILKVCSSLAKVEKYSTVCDICGSCGIKLPLSQIHFGEIEMTLCSTSNFIAFNYKNNLKMLVLLGVAVFFQYVGQIGLLVG